MSDSVSVKRDDEIRAPHVKGLFRAKQSVAALAGIGILDAGELVLPCPGGGKPIADRDRIRSADLAKLLGAMEGQPWCERGKTAQPIMPHGLAKILSEAQIRPATLRFHTGDQNGSGPTITDKGYLHAQFTEAFERYLPA